MTGPPRSRTTAGPAGFGPRLQAFVVDGVLAVVLALVAGTRPPGTAYNAVVYSAFLAIEVVFVAMAGQTPGMRVAKIAVVRARDGGRPRLGWVLVRTLLLATVVPALIADRSGRPMHDRAAGTATVRLT
jgi:uncharacterized RDD family membrane protein YckC